VSGTLNVSGLVGYAKNGVISNSFNIGSISGTSHVGGLAGTVGSSTGQNVFLIKDSYNLGSLIGNNEYTGGLIGKSQGEVLISKSYNSASVIGDSYVGGLLGGSFKIPTITNSLNSGSVSGNEIVGGLIGYVYSHRPVFVTNSVNSGSVSGTLNVGGLIGSGGGTITNSMNSGSVSGTSQVGGLIGSGGGTITNSMNSGSVIGTRLIGGLVGYAYNQLFVYYSVNFGSVIATSNSTEVGGITGVLPTTNDIEQTYFSGSITSNGVEVDGVAFGTKVTDLSTFNLAFFTTTLGWDTEIWDFTGLDIANGVYPTLKNMPEIPLEE
jgi:hypothetical protein